MTQTTTAPPTLLGDVPVYGDLLGYEPYARTLSRFLAAPELPTPYVVGVYGSWGTGKSSFMVMMERQLSEELGADHLLWFQPWLFDSKEDVWKALLYTALQHLQNLNAQPGRQSDERRERIWSLLKGLGRVTLNTALSRTTQGIVDFDRLVSLYTSSQRDTTQFLNTFRHEFESIKDELLDSTAGGEHARLVIFVDDLDRCTPDSAIMVLEAIKLFFDMPGCVFVLGIDRAVVQQGIEMRYRDDIGVSGERYLEKLIQLPFQLPPVERETFATFLRVLTDGLGLGEDTLRLIGMASEQNPRRAKRLVDCLQLLQTVSRESVNGQSEREPLNEQKLATLLILQVMFPVVFLWLNARQVSLSTLLEDPANQELLLADLREAYNDLEAARIIERLRLLLQDSAVHGFADRAELERYLRVSRLVQSEPRLDAKPLIDLLDRRMANSAPPEPSTEPNAVTTSTPDDDAGAVASVLDRALALRDRLNDIDRTGVTRHILSGRLSRTLRELTEIALRRGRYLDELARAQPTSERERRQRDEAETVLTLLNPAQLARRFGLPMFWLTFIPLAMVASWTTIQLTTRYSTPKELLLTPVGMAMLGALLGVLVVSVIAARRLSAAVAQIESLASAEHSPQAEG